MKRKVSILDLEQTERIANVISGLGTENDALRAECQQLWTALLEVRRGLVQGVEMGELLNDIDRVLDGKDGDA